MFPDFSELIKDRESLYIDKKFKVKNRNICSSIFFNAYFWQKTDSIKTVENGVVKKIINSSQKEMHDFFEKYVDKPEYLQNIFMELSQEIKDCGIRKSDLLLKCLFSLGNLLYKKQLQDVDKYKTLLESVKEIILEVFRKLTQERVYKFIYIYFITEKNAIKIYHFIAYFINSLSYKYKPQYSTSEDDLFITRDKFETLKNEIVTIFNNNAKNIQLFDKSYKDAVFLFYVEHAQEDMDLYYGNILNESESLIHICLKAFNAGQKTVDELFASNFPKINSISNRINEILNYINDGKYQNMPEFEKHKFARFVRDMNITKDMLNKKEINLENWTNLYQLANL